MGVRPADQSELERVDAELRLDGQAVFSASRAYSWGIMPGSFGTTARLPRSQISKSANSSAGASIGCCSEVPLL